MKKGHVRGGSSLQAFKKNSIFQSSWISELLGKFMDSLFRGRLFIRFFFRAARVDAGGRTRWAKTVQFTVSGKNSVFFSEPMNFDPRLKKGFFLGATLHPNLKVISWLPFYDYYDLNKSKSVTNNGAIFSDIWFQCDFFPPFYPHKSDILEDRTEQIATVPNNAQSS